MTGELVKRDKGVIADLGKSTIVGFVQQSQLAELFCVVSVVPDRPLDGEWLSRKLLSL